MKDRLEAPNKVTRAQAARILRRSFQVVSWQSKPGGKLEAETWYGTKLIPMQLVMAELARQEEVVE